MLIDARGGASRKPRATVSELDSAVRSSLGIFLGIGAISGVSNLLMLTGPLFMLEVYDRVLPSRNIPTLVGLAVLATAMLVRVGNWVDESLHGRIYEIIVRLPLKMGNSAGDGLQPLRDLDQVRTFLASSGPSALFDMPWIPIYLGICFMFHFWIGVTATVGAIILVALTAVAEFMNRGPAKAASQTAAKRGQLAAAGRRNAEVIQAMGMWSQLAAIYSNANDRFVASQRRAADVAGGLGGLARVLRMILQSAVLGVGALLVIRQEASAGIIIASSILSARALSPVDLAIANWKGFVGARQSWHRLNELLIAFSPAEHPMRLPAPQTNIAVEGMSVAPPGLTTLVAQNINFELKSGQALGIIGPSASGKSSLVRALVGVWPTARGKIRIDGAALEHWSSEELGRHVVYLPQDVELFDGTVAENIARFEESTDSRLAVC
jgi:PrtD family type I secretion system ABC transporter